MKKLFIFIFCLITLSGCFYDTGSAINSKPVQHTALNLPPSVEVVVKNTEFSTRQGSYCWSNGNVSECIDTIHPGEMLTDEDAIVVSPGETISLKIGRKPIEQELSVESDDNHQSSSVDLEDNTFKAPLEKGIYTYLFFARWDDNGNGTRGDSSNAFKIEVK